MVYSRAVFVDREIGSKLDSRSDHVAFLPQVLVHLVRCAEASIGFPCCLQQDTLSYRFLAASVEDRKSTRLNSSHSQISYAVFCLKKKTRQAPGRWSCPCARSFAGPRSSGIRA